MSTTMRRPDCFECGRPVEDRPAWLVHPECREVLRLVWYGRGHHEREFPPDMSRVRRQHRAAGIGSFPTKPLLSRIWDKGRGSRPTPQCEDPGCVEPATRFSWQPHGDARDERVRPEDIHLLCGDHHRQAVSAFLDAKGRMPHTAVATWARIEAEKPLVFRDNASYWDAGRSRLLKSWPFGNEQTFNDFEDWARLWPMNVEGNKWQVDEHGDLWNEAWNEAIEQLELPRARRRRLLRALNAGLWAYALLGGGPGYGSDRA